MQDLTKQRSRASKATVIMLIVFVAVLGIMTTVFAILYATNKSSYQQSSVSLENIYQRSFYDLVENINNTETKLAKLLSSSDSNYSSKLLTEIHENTNNAQNNLSYLPVSMNGIPETTKFINQLSGYASILAKNNSSTISAEDKKSLSDLYQSIADIKYKLNEMSMDLVKGYSISEHAKDTKEEYNRFTTRLQNVKSTDVDYPTMIYDGPFSDSMINKEIKGLNFDEITKEEATAIAEKIFAQQAEAITEKTDASKIAKVKNVSFANETNGKFSTYDFSISLDNGLNYYTQITKKGGKLLTLSSFLDKGSSNFNKNEAISIAEDFAKKQGLDNMKCVWSDVIQHNAYLNLAPVTDNIIYYPDLIKVKVDLSTGNILGWEASTYYTNHIDREIESATYDKVSARAKIGKDFTIQSEKLALSPIDYNQEILTYEFKCTKGGATYYFYINAKTGKEENILKVIETDNGSLLM